MINIIFDTARWRGEALLPRVIQAGGEQTVLLPFVCTLPPPTGGHDPSTISNLSILCTFVDPTYFLRNAPVQSTPTGGIRLFRRIHKVERFGLFPKLRLHVNQGCLPDCHIYQIISQSGK